MIFSANAFELYKVQTTPPKSNANIVNSNDNSNSNNENSVGVVVSPPPPPPLLVFVHGLDSCSNTWLDIIHEFQDSCPCVAIDQRGSGFSPLYSNHDKEELFSQDLLVQDLHSVICNCKQQYNTERVILIGHSLGGKVVMGYAAKYPVAALIVEDMDIGIHLPTDTKSPVRLKKYDYTFERCQPTQDAIINALNSVGYPLEYIDGAIASNKIQQFGPVWWSHVNPDFRKLCYQHLLSTNQAKLDCEMIIKNNRRQNENNNWNFSFHLLVASDEGTVCFPESIKEMQEMFESSTVEFYFHKFPTASHSIHSSAKEEFVKVLQNVIDKLKIK